MIFFDLYHNGGYFPVKFKKVHMYGPDIKAYLNNQTTNLILKDKVNCHCILNLQGKIEACFSLMEENSESYFAYLEDYQLKSFIERIEKYKVIEDFEIKHEDYSGFINFGTPNLDLINFNYYGLDVLLSDKKLEGSKELEKSYIDTLLGIDHQELGKLYNETRYLDFTYNRNKGCFLGQEVVSKIDVNRKAARFPVLLKNNDDLKIAHLKREQRVNGKKVNGYDVFTYPVFDLTKNEISEEYYDRALNLFTHKEEVSRAIEYLEISLKYNSKNEDAMESLGVMYSKEEKFQDAISCMHNLLEMNPESVMAHTNLSYFYMKIGDIEKAEEEKSKATLQQFKDLGKENEKNNEWEKKKSMFEQVLEIDEFDELANFGLGEYYFLKNELMESLSFFDKVLFKNKKHSVSYLGKARVLKKLGEIEKLRETLFLGIDIASKNGDFKPANEMQALLNEIE